MFWGQGFFEYQKPCFYRKAFVLILGWTYVFWADLVENADLNDLLSYFFSSYISGLSVCIFVALCVRMSVAGANKVEGTLLRNLGTLLRNQ